MLTGWGLKLSKNSCGDVVFVWAFNAAATKIVRSACVVRHDQTMPRMATSDDEQFEQHAGWVSEKVE